MAQKMNADDFTFDHPITKEMKEKVANVLKKYRQMTKEQKDEIQKTVLEAITKTVKKSPPIKQLIPLWIENHTPCFAIIMFILSSLGILLTAYGRRLYFEKRELEEEKKKKEMLEKGIEIKEVENDEEDDSDEDESNDYELKDSDLNVSDSDEKQAKDNDHKKKKEA